MNQRKQKDIARIDGLFHEIGAGEAPLPLPIREIKQIYKSTPPKQKFTFSAGCQKFIYPSEFAALKAARKRQRNRAVKLRVYRCQICQGFHLTSTFRRQ